MPFIDSSSRVGRSQGASIFWGLVSVFFAAAACFYFWKSHENESSANKYRDEVYTLQDERDTLAAEKDKLQASMSDAAGQMKAREDFLDEKEAKLAAEETRLDALAQKSPHQGSTAVPPPATPKKFSDAIQKVSQDNDAEVTTRGGRPVIRIPNAIFFAPGDATLKPDGQTILSQIALGLGSQSDNFELRVETFTDTNFESTATDASTAKTDKPDKDAKKDKPSDSAAKSKYTNSWDLTAARAAAIAHYLLNQTSLNFQNVLVIAGGDSQPISSGAKEPARNRRIEISATPLPVALHSADSAHVSSSSSTPADTSTNSLAPPPEPDAPPAKAK